MAANKNSGARPGPGAPIEHQRRPRYAGKYPRHFAEKYKERDPRSYAGTVAKVLASGKTPAGTHRAIMVEEILAILEPKPGQIAVDCTLGYGGHAQVILSRLQPGGRLLGLEADPLELPKTELRFRSLGFGPETFTAIRTNFAGLPKAVAGAGFDSVDIVLADLGASSMQLDDPVRGFSTKFEGPLDMRMNPQRGEAASALLSKVRPDALADLLVAHSDEPYAVGVAEAIAGEEFSSTTQLARAIRSALPRLNREAQELSVRRVFQALRIAVNDEFSALEMLLRQLPDCLKPGGRVAILSFHSGEDRRVKKSFEAGRRVGQYAEIAVEVIRPSAEERRDNPRSASAKLRWARKSL